MTEIIPYFIITDRCEEALNFYSDCFEGEIVFLQKYQDTEYKVSECFRNRIAHAEFSSNKVRFYASDGFENQELLIGNNIALCLNFTQKDEQKEIFRKLKEGGTVTMDFTDTSANSNLVTLIDKFGLHWYLNLE